LRQGAMKLHPSKSIEWAADGLPDLPVMLARGETFDVVLLTAVWMHLDERQRARAMPVVGALVQWGGVLIMSLRHGPIPKGRRMFDVSAEETIALAKAERLSCVVNTLTGSVQAGKDDVTWTRVAFRKA